MKSIVLLILFLLTINSFAQNKDTSQLQNDETIYENFLCDEKASFPDGNEALNNFIAEHTMFPLPPSDIQHSVYIKFEINKHGEVGQLIIFKGDEPEFNEEAIRVVKSMPKWKPAKIKGKPVNSWFIIQVKFNLQ